MKNSHMKVLDKNRVLRSNKILTDRGVNVGYGRDHHNWIFNKSGITKKNSSIKTKTTCFNRKEPNWATKFLVGILLIGIMPGIVTSEISETICRYFSYMDKCISDLEEALKQPNISEETHCLGSFDGFICWPHTEAGQIKEVPCPDHLPQGNGNESAYKHCTSNVTWHGQINPTTLEYEEWSFIGDCLGEENGTNQDSYEMTILENLRIMYNVGYSVSLACLFVALLLLSFFKKLHCTRNYIHMNLMVSFIILYVVTLVKDRVIEAHYNMEGVIENGSIANWDVLRQYCDDGESVGWVLTRCRLIITLSHYAITANMFWLLAEGLYLQMLLIFAMSENKYFSGFMVFGWGAPWISVLIWVVLRMNFENTSCWNRNSDLGIWWTIRAPIMVAVAMNFCIFINIVRIIVSKLKAHNITRTDLKIRLAKSTLALIPLLGIHYMVFFVITDDVVENKDKTVMYMKLAFEMFFSSIQGALVSALYCFFNNEVRAEVKRAWKLWRSHRNLPKGGSTFRKPSMFGSSNHSTQVTILYSRHSTTPSEIPLLDISHQSRKSSNAEWDSKDNPANHLKANGNCIALSDRVELKIQKRMDGLIAATIKESQPSNAQIGNGNKDRSTDDQVLLKRV